MNISIFLVFFVFLGVGLFLFVLCYGIFFFVFLDWMFLSLKLNFYVNSFFFSLVLFLVALSVILFSTYYMEGEINLVYFLLVFMVFVLSMFFLNFSVGIFSMLVSWDILGISSFFLVLFYNNWDSCSGAMNTVLTNRVGDFFLFVFFCFFVFSCLSFGVLVYVYCIFGLLVVLAGFTKSAQFPFSGWLPKAMSAPTPVSALVHSSTLVTAGLILIMGFGVTLMSSYACLFVMVGGLLTMIFSSICALVEQDMKKVVALSTLSQMGFSMMTLGMGLYFVSLVHLVSHALFKSCLFIQVGVFIHTYFSQQDARNYSNLGGDLLFVQLQMVVTLFCLCGLIFTSGSVTKDMILEFFFFSFWSWLLGGLFFVGVFLTFVYSYRLFYSLVRSYNFSVGVVHGTYMMGVFSFFLVFFSVCGLWWMGLNVLLVPVLYLYVDLLVPLMYVVLLLLIICFFFVMFCVEFKYKFLVDFFAKQFGYGAFFGKFVDVNFNSFVIFFSELLGGVGVLSNVIFKGLGMNIVVVVVFMLFFIFFMFSMMSMMNLGFMGLSMIVEVLV